LYFLLGQKPFSEYSFENLKTSKVFKVIEWGLLKSLKVLENEILSIGRHRVILKKKHH